MITNVEMFGRWMAENAEDDESDEVMVIMNVRGRQLTER